MGAMSVLSLVTALLVVAMAFVSRCSILVPMVLAVTQGTQGSGSVVMLGSALAVLGVRNADAERRRFRWKKAVRCTVA